jgi:phospholipase/carboxylesterase
MSDKFVFEFNFRDSNNSDELSPLVIMLHGYGSNEDDLFSFANHIPGNYKIISLRAPYSLPYGGYSWYDISSDDLEAKKIKIGVEQAKSSISKIKDFVKNQLPKKYSFDIEKICLIGFSQGSALSYALSLNNPDLFKNVIALSGMISMQLIDENHKDYSNLNYFCSHGIQDQVIPVNYSRESIEWLKSRNITHVYKEYDMTHSVSQENFFDFLEWMKFNLK